MGVVEALVTTVKRTLHAATLGVLQARDARSAVTASGVLLTVFFVLHAGGNALVFASRDAINQYAYVLHHRVGWPVSVVESYFLFGALLHLASAARLATSSGLYKELLRNPLQVRWTLPFVVMASSGLAALAFLVMHILEFKLGEYPVKQAVADPLSGGTVATEDLREKIDVFFASEQNVVFYVLGASVVAFHLYWGWRRAVVRPTLSLRSEQQPTAVRLGTALLAVSMLVYVGVPVATHLKLFSSQA